MKAKEYQYYVQNQTPRANQETKEHPCKVKLPTKTSRPRSQETSILSCRTTKIAIVKYNALSSQNGVLCFWVQWQNLNNAIFDARLKTSMKAAMFFIIHVQVIYNFEQKKLKLNLSCCYMYNNDHSLTDIYSFDHSLKHALARMVMLYTVYNVSYTSLGFQQDDAL